MSEFKAPEVKFNKNGYEIRSDILKMAADLVQFDYTAKFQQFELSCERDEKSGQIVTKVGFPPVPGLEAVLDAAEKMYNFVNRAK